ncbi:bifunctional PBS lyase HEAT-like repeat/Armadillo-like helical/Armadillo-type fold [Babesia duncani]|uniref:Bifunctional PBS lyase HEAT-like repeat/Armadillo-like helical/Armadillo-type fold n=1 Tax=Babesia duncani TaxID=323732 RepID=A0AAD9UND1_9APIC|nr:bifunctional PBS lyase HEAT-like repeat/Armadillo-like helical/Armadillo-type fold [Babesia duncani]
MELHLRYKALFNIRNLGTDDAAKYIGDALIKDTCSEVFRHECAFVLGQMQSQAAVDSLLICLLNTKEEGIVRHEAALALGSCACANIDEDQIKLIKDTLYEYTYDPLKVVADSCIVALDNIEQEKQKL